MKKLSYRNEAHEEKTRNELDRAKKALQNLLQAWNSTDLGLPCPSLWKLMFTPEKTYQEAAKSIAEVPIANGKFQLSKEVFLNILEIPTPNDLYIAAREARNEIQTGRPELWTISEDGGTVLLNQELAEALIHESDCYVETELQDQMVEACKEYAKSGKVLHEILTKLPGQGMFQGIPFVIVERYGNLIAWLEIEPVQLRGILDQMKKAGI